MSGGKVLQMKHGQKTITQHGKLAPTLNTGELIFVANLVWHYNKSLGDDLPDQLDPNGHAWCLNFAVWKAAEAAGVEDFYFHDARIAGARREGMPEAYHTTADRWRAHMELGGKGWWGTNVKLDARFWQALNYPPPRTQWVDVSRHRSNILVLEPIWLDTLPEGYGEQAKQSSLF